MINRNQVKRLLNLVDQMEAQLPHHCTTMGYKVLLRVALNPGCGTLDIGDDIGIIPQNISRVIRKLIAGRPDSLAFIEAYPSPMNLRIPLYRLTPKGEAMINELCATLFNEPTKKE